MAEAKPVFGRIGDIGESGGMICGLVEPNVEDSLPTSSHFGWVPEGTFIYASLRDDEGNLFTCSRKLLHSATLGLMIVGAVGASGRRARRQREARAAFRGEFEQGIASNGDHLAESPPGVRGPASPMQPMRVVRRPTSMIWDEGDVLYVEGDLVGGLGSAVMLARAGPAGGMYTSFMHYGAGHVCGREVTGMFAFAQNFFPPGVSWWDHAWRNRLEFTWFDIGIRYEDGSLESGILMTGQGGFGGCVVQRDGVPVIATNDVTATVVRNDDLFPERVDYLIGGSTRGQWTSAPHGEIEFPSIPGVADIYRNADGEFRFEGDDRRHTADTGWLDTYIDGRDGFAAGKKG